MLDVTFLLVGFLILMALQSNQLVVAAGLFVVLLATAKSKALLLAALIIGGLGLLYLTNSADPLILIAGLLIVLVILVRSDSSPGPQGYYPS